MSNEKSETILDHDIEQLEIEDPENDKQYQEQKKKYIIKGLISILSCIFHTCGYYSFFILGHNVVYLISFRRYFNPNITFSHGYFLFPIMYFTLSLTIPIGGIIENKIGGKKTIILSTSIICLSLLLMYISKYLFVDYILMSFIGLGIALGLKLSKRNACSFFMNRKALISGIVTLVPTFVCVGLAIYNEKYILNPLSERPTIENTYYEKRIFLNFQKLLIYEILFLILMCVLSLVTFYKNDPKETIKFGFGEKIKENKINKEMKKEEKNGDSKLMQVLKNRRPYKQFLMIFLYYPTISFIQNTWRPIGIYYKINTKYLQIIGALANITGSLSSIIFSLIGDKIQFRYLFAFSGLLLSIISFIFPISFTNTKEILFIFEILLIYFALNGFNIIIDPHLMKVYGLENFVQICGIIRTSSGIAEISSVSFAFYLEKYFTGNKDIAYKWMYFTSGCFSFIAFVLGIFENDEKFDYNKN